MADRNILLIMVALGHEMSNISYDSAEVVGKYRSYSIVQSANK